MTTSAFATEHGNDARDDAGDAYQDVEAHDGEEDRVNRRHRNAEHDGCVIRHAISLSHRLVRIGATGLGCCAIVAHCRLEQTRYRENAFEACRD